MIVLFILVAIWIVFPIGFLAGVAWKTNRVEDQTTADGEQLPARGSAHVDHAPPAGHRSPSRFTGRQVPHDSDGGRQ